jgi:TolB-like protein
VSAFHRDIAQTRGYRFIAAVETNSREPHASEQTATTHLAHSAAQQRSIGRTAFLTGAIGIIVIATVLPVLWKRTAGPVSRHSKILLAVLPFDNLSSDRSQDYLTEGMTEELITQLGRWNPERLGVIARTSTDLYKGANKSVAEVGRQLSVDYIVEGSARRNGDQVRITAQLIQVRDQTHLWAKEYDRDEHNLLALENEVATDVADEIKVKLSANTKAEIRPVDAQAHEAYLKGRHYWNQLSCKAFENALPLFENAVQRDPNFALADASLAETYYKEYEFGCRPAEEVIPKAKQAALRAIQLDDQLGEAHAALGVIANGFDWNWVTAEQELKLATELSPNNAIAHSWYMVNSSSGRRATPPRQCCTRLFWNANWNQVFATNISELTTGMSLAPIREFTRRSDKDSICMMCFQTVRPDRYTSLEHAEREHAAVCQPLRLSFSDLRRVS